MTPNPAGSYSGGAGGAAGPSTATSSTGFNTSGWSVDFGSGKTETKWLLAALAVAGAYLVWTSSSRGR